MTRNKRNLFATLRLIVLCLSLQLLVPAQEPQQPQRTLQDAQKFDSYGKVGECDEGARLDNFALELQNNPNVKGYILTYTGVDDLPVRIPGLHARSVGYLTNQRGIETERIVAVNGGYRKDRTIELWIVPPDAVAPEPTDTIEFRRDPRQAYKYDALYVDMSFEQPEPEQNDEAIDEAEQASIEQTSVEQVPAEEESVDEETIDALPRVEFATAAVYDDKGELESKAGVTTLHLTPFPQIFVEQFKKDKTLNAYLLYYGDDKDEAFQHVARLVEAAKAYLSNHHQIDVNRVRVVYGGFNEHPTVELWIAPEGADAPKPTVYPREKPDQTTIIDEPVVSERY